MAHIIDGKAAARSLRARLANDVQELQGRGVTPGLAVILVGDDPASALYVNHKIAACAETGIKSTAHRLPATTSESDLLALIATLNADPSVHGILLQLPLPAHLHTNVLLAAINPAKDVDGLHPLNLGRLMAGAPIFTPCTPQGAMILLQNVRENLAGLHAVVIGRSLLFGKPMGQLLLNADCTVTQCHSKTKDLPDLCRQADILIAAIGQPNFIKADFIKEGAIVIDVGINRTQSGIVTGDVDFEHAKNIAAAITPVPGGVGQMTIACLLANTLRAASDC